MTKKQSTLERWRIPGTTNTQGLNITNSNNTTPTNNNQPHNQMLNTTLPNTISTIHNISNTNQASRIQSDQPTQK